MLLLDKFSEHRRRGARVRGESLKIDPGAPKRGEGAPGQPVHVFGEWGAGRWTGREADFLWKGPETCWRKLRRSSCSMKASEDSPAELW